MRAFTSRGRRARSLLQTPPGAPIMNEIVDRPDRFGLVGRTLADKYRVEALVEETAMSVVYRAVHRVWRRPVAIKAFKAPPLAEEARRQLLEAFVREGALLSELSERTSAVCQARDVASLTTPSGDWVPYMVLEWLDGLPLDALLLKEQEQGVPRRSVDEALRLLEPVATALELAHERGIVHRDVKPGNVCILSERAARGSACAKLYDFGIATVMRHASAGGETASVVSSFTPAYAAPEQFSSEYGTVGPWTDVFALALVFVELVTARPALQGEALGELAQRACDPAERPTPRALGVDVGDDVERVLLRALAVQPELRHQTAGQFWSALTRSAKQRFMEATIPIPLTRPRPKSGGRWVLPAVALASAGGAAAFVLSQHWAAVTQVLHGVH